MAFTLYKHAWLWIGSEDEEPQPASIVNAMAAVNATLNICFFFMIPSFRKAPGIPVQTEMPVCRPLRIFPLS